MQVPARIGRGLVVVAGALLMLWPAVVNGYPLLYPDSMSYLGDGRPLARILFLHAPKGYGAMRSEFYSLGIFPFHWNVTAWPIVVLQAVLTSYVLWLVVRSFAAHSSGARAFDSRRATVQFVLLVALLSLTTSLAWYVCFIMPDILGPLLYLAVYLLVFAHETLSTREKCAVAVIAAWAMAAHSTHLMLAIGLWVLLDLLFVLRWPPLRERGRAIGSVVGIILVVAAGQMALHGYLYGKATLLGNRMPYTMARFVADGPGRWYLQAHCGTLDWAICARVHDLPNGALPDNDDDFLWADGGVWAGATPEQQEQMLREEWPLVLATARAYPGAQVRVSLNNFGTELTNFGLWDFTPNPWMGSEIDKVLPGALPTYLRTREAQSRLPTDFFTAVQQWVVLASALAIVVCVPLLWRRRRWRVLGLVTVLVPAVIANAFLTAVFSEVDSRYQSRVVWLIPLLAGLIMLDLLEQRRQRREATGLPGSAAALP
ncbi:MAG: hypothetical protein ABSG84_15840 [Acidobacteriaceae bacterium]|jgi:hypothetical protein